MIKLNDHLKNRALRELKEKGSVLPEKILISDEATEKIPAFIKGSDYGRVMLIGSQDRREAADRLYELFQKENIETDCHILEEGFTPDKEKVGELIVSTPEDTGLIIAAGGRQINDLCKYVSSRLGIPYTSYPTSPCIEGFISDRAILLSDGEEEIHETAGPVALFADTSYLNRNCPVARAQLYGILLNLFEWKTKGLVTDGTYDRILTAVKEARSDKNIRKIMNAIITRDMAILTDKEGKLDLSSASDLAQYLEAETYRKGKKPLLKERCMALSLISCLKMYEKLAKGNEDAKDFPDTEECEKELLDLGAAINPEQLSLSKASLKEGLEAVFDGNTLTGEKGCTEEAASYFDDQKTYKEYKKKRNQEMIDKVKMFVLDMDGTIYLSNDLFPFTKDFLDKVKESGREAYYFTNNSSKNQGDYLSKLERLGIPTDEKHMMLSTQVIIEYLKEKGPNDTYYIVGTDSLVKAFRDAGLALDDEHPDTVILGFDTSLNYEKLEKACTFLRHGAKYYGVNMDYNCPVAGGEYIPDCGSIAKLVERSTGRFPEFFGKPSHHTLDYIIKETGYKEDEICVIGDRIYTDIKVADGRDTLSIMVLTGETQLEDLENYDYRPDIIMESLAEVTEYL